MYNVIDHNPGTLDIMNSNETKEKYAHNYVHTIWHGEGTINLSILRPQTRFKSYRITEASGIDEGIEGYIALKGKEAGLCQPNFSHRF